MFALIACLILVLLSFNVNNSSHQIMCFSKMSKEKLDIVKILDNVKLSDEFEGSCDYIELESRKGLTSDPKNLTLIQLNIRGLISKTSALSELITENIGSIQPDVVILCETWLNITNITKIDIPNYKLIGNVRNGKIGGGTGILVHKSLRCRERKDLEIKSITFEHTVIELKTETTNLLLVSGYRPPNSNIKEFLRDYKLAVKTWQNLKHHELVIGINHNLDFLKSDKRTQTQTFLEFNLDSDMMPTITRPTRVTQTSATLIDNVFISKRLQNNYSSLILIDDISDHFPSIVFLKHQKLLKKEPIKIKTREINDSKIMEIKNKLDKINWVEELCELDSDSPFSSFHTYLVETIDNVIPEKTKTVNYSRII